MSMRRDSIIDGMKMALWKHAVDERARAGKGPKVIKTSVVAAEQKVCEKAAEDLARLISHVNHWTDVEQLHASLPPLREPSMYRFGWDLAELALRGGASPGGVYRGSLVSTTFPGIVVPRFSIRFNKTGEFLDWEGVAPEEETVSRGSRIERNPFGYRVPTDEELASAWRYIENEYTLKEGNVDGEQWAEGLAFGRSMEGLAKVDPTWYRDLMAAARAARPQLTDDQWAMIAARADRLRADQGEVAKFKTKTNPSVEQDLGINPQHRRQWMPSMVDDDPPSHNWPRSEVQSLLFSVDHFTEASARAWAQKHGYRYGKVDTTEHYHRLRQFEPTGSPCRTMELPGTHPVVKAVVCRGQ